MMNGFFDCANVRSTTESLRKRNDFLAPYRNTNDERFKWLEDTFIKYLEDWKAAVNSREGQYTPDERGRMFLSLQTFQGLKSTLVTNELRAGEVTTHLLLNLGTTTCELLF